MFDRMDF